jgi:Flp pilus assembly protein TadD
MGESLLKLRRPKQAVGYFSVAREDPDFAAPGLQGVGICMLLLDDVETAELRLEEAVELDGSLWRAHNALGQIRDSRQDWAGAARAYEAALAANPEAAAVYNNRGMSTMMQENFKAAIRDFERAVNLDPSLEQAQTNLRIALALDGAYIDAFAGVERSRMADMLNNIGYAAMVRGDFEVAESYFVRAMEASPTYHNKAAINLERVRYLQQRQSSEPVS